MTLSLSTHILLSLHEWPHVDDTFMTFSASPDGLHAAFWSGSWKWQSEQGFSGTTPIHRGAEEMQVGFCSGPEGTMHLAGRIVPGLAPGFFSPGRQGCDWRNAAGVEGSALTLLHLENPFLCRRRGWSHSLPVLIPSLLLKVKLTWPKAQGPQKMGERRGFLTFISVFSVQQWTSLWASVGSGSPGWYHLPRQHSLDTCFSHRTHFISIVHEDVCFPCQAGNTAHWRVSSYFALYLQPQPAACWLVPRGHMFFKKFGNILKYNFTDGIKTDVLWMKSSQCKSKKRQDLLGANTGKEDRHPGASRESEHQMTEGLVLLRPGRWRRRPALQCAEAGFDHSFLHGER